jgi:hypothetical protein
VPCDLGDAEPCHLRDDRSKGVVRFGPDALSSIEVFRRRVATFTVPDEPVITAFGVVALTFMMVMYAMEDRGRGSSLPLRWVVHSPAPTASSQERGHSVSSRLSGVVWHFADSRWELETDSLLTDPYRGSPGGASSNQRGKCQTKRDYPYQRFSLSATHIDGFVGDFMFPPFDLPAPVIVWPRRPRSGS